MRLFVALDIDAEIRGRIQRYVSALRSDFPQIRFVSAETYHVTLKFLGETSNVAATEQALSKARGNHFELRFGGTGFFPGEKNARVFWAGIQTGDELLSLQSEVESALNPLGFPREKIDYHPHLTLARSGSGRPQRGRGDRDNSTFRELIARVSSEPQPEFGTMTARDFFLYESKLSPNGPQYRKVRQYPLGTY